MERVINLPMFSSHPPQLHLLMKVVFISTYKYIDKVNQERHCNELFCFSEVFRKQNVIVLSDEIYARVTFDDSFFSISKVSTARGNQLCMKVVVWINTLDFLVQDKTRSSLRPLRIKAIRKKKMNCSTVNHVLLLRKFSCDFFWVVLVLLYSYDSCIRNNSDLVVQEIPFLVCIFKKLRQNRDLYHQKSDMRYQKPDLFYQKQDLYCHIAYFQVYPEGTILCSGMSKWASMGGWRVRILTRFYKHCI